MLVVSSIAAAEPHNLPAQAFAGLREMLNQPGQDLAPLAKSLFGEKAGEACFYFPTHDQPATPASYGYNYENVRFASADGTRLHGWFLPASGKRAKGTVVFSHGNAGSLGHHLGFALWWVNAGYNLLMYDYRGFGKSAGAPARRGMVDDVKAAFAYASQHKLVDRGRLISYGHSLGGAKSITALGETPVKGLRAVIVDGAFCSYRGMAKLIGGALAEDLVTDELAPLAYVKKLSPVPLLVVHGACDEIVPVTHGRELFAAAAEPKRMFEVKTGRHSTALSGDRGAYRREVLAWLETTVPPKAIAVK